MFHENLHLYTVAKATNYKLLIFHPGETMKSMQAGGRVVTTIINIIILLYNIK